MRDFLEKASLAYYSGCPIISDAEFDALVKKYNYDQVGHQVTDGYLICIVCTLFKKSSV